MVAWWDALPLFSQIMYAIAAPSTVILIIQLVLSFFDGDDTSEDADVSGIEGADTDFSGADIVDGVGGDIADGADVDIADGVDVSDVSELADGGFADRASIDDGDFSPEAAERAESLDADLAAMRVFTFRGIIAFLCSFSWTTLAIYATGAPHFLALIIGFVVGVAMMFAVAKLIHTLLGLAENGTVRFSEAVGRVGKVYIPIPADGMGKIIIDFDGAERECDATTRGDRPLATETDVIVTGLRGETLIVEAI